MPKNFVLLMVPALVAAIVSFALTPLSMRLAKRIGAVDRPGPRKVHTTAIPRLGGLAVLASVVGVAVSVAALSGRPLLTDQLTVGIAFGLLPILIVSLIDDARSLRALPKALSHLIGASIAVSLGVRLNPEIHLFGQDLAIGWLAFPLSILWLVGLTNAFNLVDGLDGLSAGLAFISAASLGAVSIVVDRHEMAVVAFVLAGSLVGFLPYNLHPARTFLGDTGSTGIGFCLGCLALKGGSTLSSGLAVLVPIIVMGLPIAETLVSMARRVVRGLRHQGRGSVFEADGEHFHHRLLKLGLNHRRAVFLLYGIGIFLGAIGVLSLFVSHTRAGLLLWTILAAAFIGVARLGYEEFDVIRKGEMLRLYEVPMLRSALFVALLDLAIAAFAIYFAWVLKYDRWAEEAQRLELRRLLAVGPFFALAAFWSMGLYRRSWKLASFSDLTAVGGAVTASTLLTLAFGRFFWVDSQPVSYYFIFLLIFGCGTVGARASYRVLYDWMLRSRHDGDGEPVLIYGAGVSGSLALREILRNEALDMRPVGFIDDDPHKRGMVMSGGVRVVGSIDTLEETLTRQEIHGAVIASRKIPADKIRQAAGICAHAGIWMKVFTVGFDVEAVAQPGAPWGIGTRQARSEHP